jgi:hypothetical protein
VDEVQRKLALLPADVAVADVAPAWLSGWDAARLCELLRLLASPTTAARAVQLFDWLRALPQDSPLVPLRSPDAFAVMIHLYGGWRRPKPAVRLFAELKDRGEDTPEVHSALVHAFCRWAAAKGSKGWEQQGPVMRQGGQRGRPGEAQEGLTRRLQDSRLAFRACSIAVGASAAVPISSLDLSFCLLHLFAGAGSTRWLWMRTATCKP